ncbi:hypothetical protein HNR42_000644 [Deinobacterium chartae]|uniref:Uncharacterized protein n=1 Tax=Deinobacterium chartae TaxID=521158 RepID=A0A841HYD7_9DEIO|nr:hypothetical protein [Deinobacterium chartae]MBB6097230.1 hypothetical protein [Deinobacterium chartae]
MRLILPFVILLPLAFTLAWLLRRVSGNFWVGMAGGPLGIFAGGVLLGSLEFVGWLDLGETPLQTGLSYLVVLGWNLGLLGGLIGTLMGARARRHA